MYDCFWISHTMNEHSITSQSMMPLPSDDLQRSLKIARPNTDQSLPHIALAGDTYTILLSGEDTNGRYCLIDMHVPPGGGPPPHRHDFEESFTLLEGEIEVTFRGEKSIVRAGETVRIPASAPHSFINASEQTATAAVHLRTSRTGRVFRTDRFSCGDADDAAAEGRQNRAGRAHQERPKVLRRNTARSCCNLH